MQDLRLVGVHEGGEHLLLSGKGGETFRLRMDEALRVAVSRSVHRPTAPVERPEGPAMTPRDIQARIRSGASAEDVAEVSGLDLARIRRYEGPVRAERDYVARQAQAVEVAAPLSAAHDGYRSTFGDSPVSLGDMVSHRLKAFGVDPDSVEWDAWRRPDSTWDVVARFDFDEKSRISVGEEPPARWTFSPLRKSVSNANRWAQLLSELEPLDSPLPSRRLTAVADRVFDFEAVPAPGADDADGAGDEETENLLEVLRSRRGQRLGADEDGDDALAALLAKGSIPAAHPREGGNEPDDASSSHPRTGRLTLAPDVAEADAPDRPDSLRLTNGANSDTREVSILARPFRRRGEAAAGSGTTPPAAASPAETSAGAEKSSVSAKADDTGTETTTHHHDAADGTVAGAAGASAEPDAPAKNSKAAPAARGKGKNAGRKGGRTDFPWDRMGSGTGRTDAAGASETGKDDDADRRPPKPKRSSVPSWDDIVFGTKGD
ncbi:septation protein SepH [Arthrobacter sp. APC 3897]|uniref:septation protein SepH n=1 Tax=Arthrobacter sp. APC 3897 TaxID=3035204 RepID=UPI0025B5FC66|nr:septation protein SepH [Arthrobacter sp. APC 3897]MDN3482476.1 septation protein SepH [Arthrobacter sp. APC 3897]